MILPFSGTTERRVSGLKTEFQCLSGSIQERSRIYNGIIAIHRHQQWNLVILHLTCVYININYKYPGLAWLVKFKVVPSHTQPTFQLTCEIK